MKPATNLLRANMSAAVMLLRTRMQWSQGELATAIHAARLHNGRKLRKNSVSRWERELAAPSRLHRIALQGIATANNHDDLARAFGLRP